MDRRANSPYLYIMVRLRLLIFLLVSAVTSLQAQDDAVTTQFSVYEINGDAYLYWVIAEGSSCTGIGVERSEDGIAFIEIGEITGVCGNVSFPTAYDFTDKYPITNKNSYYRLRLGNGGYSDIASINILETGEAGYLLYPNPASSSVNIKFRNELNKETVIEVYNAAGRLVTLTGSRNGLLNLDVESFSSGLYHFRILQEEIVTGTFLITR